MSVQLNHTIVAARDKQAAATFLATVLGLEVSAPYGPFLPVETGNGVQLDYMDSDDDPIPSQHYARASDRPQRSTTATVDAARTSRIRTATTWRSSPGRTAAAGDGRQCPASRGVLGWPARPRHGRCGDGDPLVLVLDSVEDLGQVVPDGSWWSALTAERRPPPPARSSRSRPARVTRSARPPPRLAPAA